MGWYEDLKSHGDHVQSIAAQITQTLAQPELTLDQASELYKLAVDGSQQFDDFQDALNDDDDADDNLLNAAEYLDDMWSRLVVATANKVRSMQGLSTIEMPD